MREHGRDMNSALGPWVCLKKLKGLNGQYSSAWHPVQVRQPLPRSRYDKWASRAAVLQRVKPLHPERATLAEQHQDLRSVPARSLASCPHREVRALLLVWFPLEGADASASLRALCWQVHPAS